MIARSVDRTLRIVSFRAARPWFRPGSEVTVEVALHAAARTTATATLSLLDLDRVVDRSTARFRVRQRVADRTMAVRLPGSARHGYGLRLELAWPGGRAAATTSVEALDGWWQSPRHAAVTHFQVPARTAAAVEGLRDWHVTVVQLYDWMYRHYRYEPPHGSSFTDTLGRLVSHEAVRAGVQAGHRAGIASLAYGSIYGAEREYVDAHPDERVFDADGLPLSLGETFYITDPRPGPWRRRLLAEYARAMRRFAVDGIHMDTYGPPYQGIGADGRVISFADAYPGLIAEAAATVAAVRPGGRVLFNCVEGFPLERVADAPAAAIYLELWPPDVAFIDVVRWIDRARQLGAGRAVVIAAYISALRAHETERASRAGAIEAAVLLSSLIAAAGGYHHVLADRDRLLVEGYYPEARRLRKTEQKALRAVSAFTARFLHLLSDPACVAVDPAGLELSDAEGRQIPLTSTPRAGCVWVRLTRTADGSLVANLLDLLDQLDDRWDAVRQPSPWRTDWRLRWPAVTSGRSVDHGIATVAMSPWTNDGEPRPVADGGLPRFRRWLTVVAPTGV